MNASDFAIAWWRDRHDHDYFPGMDQHRDWKVYDELEDWILNLGEPRRTDNALEIGCGYGQRMVPMAKLVRHVSGFDIHPRLFEQSLISFAETPNADMKLGDGKTIPYPDGAFDLVYSISVFQHMPRDLVCGYIRETVRVLKPDGRALFHFRHDDGLGLYAKDIEVNHSDDWSVGWSDDQVREACEAAGLRVVRDYHWVNMVAVRAERA